MPKEKSKILYETGTPFLDDSQSHRGKSLKLGGVNPVGEIEEPRKIVPNPLKNSEAKEVVKPLVKP